MAKWLDVSGCDSTTCVFFIARIISSKLCQIAVEKVAVASGSHTTVTLDTGAVTATCPFCIYDPKTGDPSVPVGTKYEVYVGNGGGAFMAPFTITAS